MMNKELKWQQREEKTGREREEKSFDPSELYIQRRVGMGSHSRAKAGNQSKLEKHVTAYEKEVERRRELENKRLLRRIS